MTRKARAIQPCQGDRKSKLIVRLVDYHNEPLNGVKVYAKKQDSGENLTQKTERLQKHAKKRSLWGRGGNRDGVGISPWYC